MFNADKFYKHDRMIDVCFKVRRRTDQGSDNWKVEISWYLRRGLRPMALSETITINFKDFKYYREIRQQQ